MGGHSGRKARHPSGGPYLLHRQTSGQRGIGERSTGLQPAPVCEHRACLLCDPHECAFPECVSTTVCACVHMWLRVCACI